MNKIFLFLALFVGLAGSGCVGVDYIDDPIVGARIEVEDPVNGQKALQLNETFQAKAVFYDQYGIKQDVVLTWVSSAPAVASVNNQGLITALSGGQAAIVASFEGIQNQLAINVVLDDNQVAAVTISSPNNTTSLMPAQSVMLSAVVKNIKGMPLMDREIEWFSENPAIATVNADGVVTGSGSGMVDIHAKVEGVKSNIISFSIGGGRSGMFASSGGYKAVGTASLSLLDNKLKLELSSNFETSFALGTFIYLANSTNGAQVKSGGLEIAQITTNGAKTFDISAISPTTGLLDYKYVIILCKPASLTFGFAELK